MNIDRRLVAFLPLALVIALAVPAEAATVRGRLLDSVSLLPPDDPELEMVLFAGPDHVQRTFPDAGGYYAFNGLPAGTYTLLALGADYLDQCWLRKEPHVWCPEYGTPIVLQAATDFEANFLLVPLGRLAGTVRREDGSPVVGAQVSVYLFGQTLGTWLTDGAGRYRSGPLDAGGGYRVRVASGQGLYGVVFPHELCLPESAICGTTLTVTDGATVADVDFALRPGGALRGDAQKPDGALLTTPYQVQAYDRLGKLIAVARAAQGAFDLGWLAPGRYTLLAEGDERVIFPDLPCTECDVRFGEPVALDAGSERNVRFQLPLRGRVRIEVRDARTQEPIGSDARVQLTDSRTGERYSAPAYHWEGDMLPGSYYVTATGDTWLREALGGLHLDSSPDQEMLLQSTPLEVRPGQGASAVLELDPAPRIQGRALRIDGSAATDCKITIYTTHDRLLRHDDCGDDGRFDLVLNAADPVWVLVSESYENGTGVLHDGRVCSFRSDQPSCELAGSAPLRPAAGATVDLGDLRLPRTGSLSGQVVGAAGIRGDIELYDLAGRLQRTSLFAEAGAYTVADLAPGAYRVKFAGRGKTSSQVYPGLPCARATCDVSLGAVVEVGPGTEVGNVDFMAAMLPAACDWDDGCLSDDRFRVAVRWTDPHNNVGAGRQQVHGDRPDTGYFWFFYPDNTELLVKVLDACQPPYGRFWVFAAGTTNVGVDIDVTDTVTGETRSYHQPGGPGFVPVLDTVGFPCSEGAAPPLPPAPQAAPAPMPMNVAAALAPELNTSYCLDRPEIRNSLCLYGRFRVDSTWQSFDGSEGRGQVYSHPFGSFYFFDPNNVEIMMKVLDGCAINGHYWVFGTGLTNVGVRLVVTDTYTDRQKVYENALGHAFEPILDTAAFTCWRE